MLKIKLTPLFLGMGLLALAGSVQAQNAASNPPPEKSEAELKAEQAEVLKKMHARRMEMMETNSELKRLQAEKRRLHERMAVVMSEDAQMAELQKEFSRLEQAARQKAAEAQVKAENEAKQKAAERKGAAK